MTTFKDFLKTQEEHLLAKRADDVEKKKKWSDSVLSLFNDITKWIHEADPHQLTSTRIQQVGSIHTDGSGTLRDPDDLTRMSIILGNVFVNLTPLTKDPIWPRHKPSPGSWVGEVMMSSTFGRFQIYLFETEGKDLLWFIRNTKHYEMKPLDQANFEAALVELLS